MVIEDFCTDLSQIKDLRSFLDGQMLLIDKPLGWTSFDVVNKIRAMLRHALKIKKIKVGHAGTLDPLASGLMIVCTGKATKNIEQLMGFDKTYEALVRLGATTPSCDLEAEVDYIFPTEHLTASLLEAKLQQFLGEQIQVPPIFSAIKIGGKKACDMARNGVDFKMKSRQVFFHQLELLGFEENEARVLVRCSKGTYIRSFARDLGAALDSGGHLAGLRRTAIGPLSVDQAMTIASFKINFDRIETI